MRMPVVDGLEATRQIKSTKQGHETVVIALSASAFDEDREKFLKAGCDDFIRKPYREAEIFDKIAHEFDIEYRYEQTSTVHSAFDKHGILEPEDFNGLSKDWLTSFQTALIELDPQKIESNLSQIESDHSILYQKLHELSQSFNFDVILDSLNDYTR